MGKIYDYLESHDFNETVMLTGFDDAVIGITYDEQLVYDYEKMIKIHRKNASCDRQEAIEYIDFNVINAIRGMGEYAPILMFAIK